MKPPASSNPHWDQPVLSAGEPLDRATAAMVLVHGRGATARGMIELAGQWMRPGLALLAPQAAGHTWYPFSFMAPLAQNEPFLGGALATVGQVIEGIEAAGVPRERMVILGFSQGACLATEFVARNASRFGGVAGLSGGLIGPDGTAREYPGSLRETPVFLGCSDVDSHIPAARVRETAAVLKSLGGDVTMRLYPGMGHTINDDEITAVSALLDPLMNEG